jgi:hypothetical protein
MAMIGKQESDMANARAVESEQQLPIPRWAIWASCLVMTPIFGSILYYAWKNKNPAAANLANRVSWISWLLWMGLFALRRFVLG